MNFSKVKPAGNLKWVLVVTMAFFIASCGRQSSQNDELAEVDTDYITISATVPNNPQDQSPEGLAKFAWEEFLALNWQSSWQQTSAGSDADKRGIPNSTWDPTTDGYGDQYQVVWETYAHVTELRPGDDNMRPFDEAPHYSYIDFNFKNNAARDGLDSLLFNNLDEDSEIGSCNVYPPGTVVDGKPSELVLYEAKANRDEYDYVLNNYSDSTKLQIASDKTKANILKDSAYYAGGTSNCNCPADEGVICLPCGGDTNPTTGKVYEGALEVKTAWQKVKQGENTSSFFTRNNIYYFKDSAMNIVYDNALFKLIGMHVIHKTKDNPEFVFASWQHMGVEEKDYQLQLLNSGGDVVGQPSSYSRYSPVPAYLDSVNKMVHQQIGSEYSNGLGVWQNYRLIGVQGKPVDYADRASDPNYFMANYVIESDTVTAGTTKPGLANFHGYGFASDPFYVNNDYNILVVKENKFLDAGGCMGCHGVAQTTEGSDFSFLLDHGAGKPVANPATINSIIPSEKTNIKNYIIAIAK